MAFVATGLEMPEHPVSDSVPLALTGRDFGEMNPRIDSRFPGASYRFGAGATEVEAPAPLGMDDALLASISGDLPERGAPRLTDFELERPFLKISVLFQE